MDNATTLKIPSTRLSGNLLSVSQNPIFLKDQNIEVGWGSSTNSTQHNGSCCDL